MEFTYKAYKNLIELLKEKNYNFADYKNYREINRPVIFRHGIDMCLEDAIEIARIEKEEGISSTYFVLLSTDFYNIFSKESHKYLKKIIDLGHDIGLHFDERRYEIKDENDLEKYVEYEKNVLEGVLDREVGVVSMHIPSSWILENDIKFKSIINSYSKTFFREFKYLSDSMMHWRENVLEIIEKQEYEKLHILTHPFWYGEGYGTIEERARAHLNNANINRYTIMKDVIINLEEILRVGDME